MAARMLSLDWLCIAALLGFSTCPSLSSACRIVESTGISSESLTSDARLLRAEVAFSLRLRNRVDGKVQAGFSSRTIQDKIDFCDSDHQH